MVSTFQDSDFSVEDLDSQKIEDKEFEALVDEDASQTEEELAESLGVTQ